MNAAHADAQPLIERSHDAWGEFVRGDPKPAQALFSHTDDVSLGNPFGPFVTGWQAAADTMERAADPYRDGPVVSFETVSVYMTAELVCLVEVERYVAKIGASNELSSVAFRVTSVVRREDDGWKIVHRHADPITTTRPPESVIPRA